MHIVFSQRSFPTLWWLTVTRLKLFIYTEITIPVNRFITEETKLKTYRTTQCVIGLVSFL